MPKTKISEYSATANSNTDVASINIDEGCAPSGINNAIRAVMGHLKDFQSGTSNDPFTVGSSGSLTLSYGTINGVAYLNGAKVLTTGSALTFNGTNVDLDTVGAKLNFATTGSSTRNYIGGSADGYSLEMVMQRGASQPLSYKQNYSVGHEWGIAGSGAMTLTSTGLGIGTSSPLGLLNIKGSNGQLVLNNGASSGGVRLSAFTNAGTANGYLAFEGYSSEYGRFDSSGNLGIGTTSPATKLHISTDGTYDPLRLQSTQSGYARSWTIGPNVGANGFFVIRDSTAGENRLAIDSSGNLLVGTTGTGGLSTGRFRIEAASGADAIRVRHPDASGGTSATMMLFISTADAAVGSITSNGTSTAYNTSSDYRLKNTIAPMTGALVKLAQLKPVTYKWNADGSDGEGFIAHELAEVVPQCVTGEKDAVDADGKPVYQGIDTSFLVATLTAAIQELKAEFDAYKASHP